MKEELIAPGGMNCGLCISCLAMKNGLKKKGTLCCPNGSCPTRDFEGLRTHKNYCRGCNDQ